MLSTKPYLFKAFYEWIVDNEWTPYIVINVDYLGVKVPKQYVEDGQIVLNIAPEAVLDFSLTKQAVDFKARFSGVLHPIYVPIAAIVSVYARENGHGIFFDEEANDLEANDLEESEEEGTQQSKAQASQKGNKKSKGGHLTIVK